MNGNWYDWGYQRTPKVFVAAWRLYRQCSAHRRNQRDLAVDSQHQDTQTGKTRPPVVVARQRLCELGRDRRLLHEGALDLAPMFGPTIGKIREFTHDPILIETGAGPVAGQSRRSPTCSLASTPTGCWVRLVHPTGAGLA
jgi:hypothetical protein